MQAGFEMFTHAIRMVFGNFAEALKLSAIPYLLTIAAGLAIAGTLGSTDLAFPAPSDPSDPSGTVPQDSATQDPGGAALMLGLLLIVLDVIALCWIAVGWHRFILKSEYPEGPVPAWHGAEIRGYLWKSILLGLIFVLFMIPAILLIALMSGSAPTTFIAIGAVMIGFYVVSLRLGLVLPAAAIGSQQTFGWSGRTTQPYNLAIVTLAVLSVAVYLILGAVAGAVALGSPMLALIVQAAFDWLILMIGVSLLTTVYGVAVEGREV